MLTATFRGSPQPHMQAHRRGRSRHVSPVALARQASEERRRSLPPITDSLPHSLEQIQAAYALGDIRLAKILLLRLQGIYVTDDTDPRIDQVRDEDFEICFSPSSPLPLDDADRRALRRQRQWWHESQRTQRLKTCEILWEHEKSRLHAQRQHALQQREHDTLDQGRARLAERSHHRATRTMPRLEASSKRHEDPFQYAFMLPSKPSASTLPAKSHKKAHSPGRHSRSVSFKEVINAMNGQLFPLDAYERADDARRIAGVAIPSSNTHRRRTSARAELLDSLLQVAEWEQGERRKVKGKDVVRDQQAIKSHICVPTPLPTIPSSLSAASVSSSSSPSRSNSWLTFGSWRSTATDITTPDSPVLASPASSLPCLPTLAETEIRREPHPRSAFVRISLEESPLCPSITSHPSYLEDDGLCATPSDTVAESVSIRGALVKRVTRSVATIIEAAKGLQSAYIAATMFSAGCPLMDTAGSTQPRGSTRCQRQARREGYRALPKDVRRFTDSASCISQPSEPVHFIPLVSHPSGKSGLPKPPIPKDAVIFPSPLRPRTPPAALGYRMRPVANPAVLRLRALQNIMCARGKEWEGRAREGGLGCGKERMLGVAFEGRGRSGLGCEVRFVVA